MREVIAVNEHCAGAVEALSWVLQVLEQAVVKNLDLASIITEVEHIHDELLRGVAVDFERRVLKY